MSWVVTAYMLAETVLTVLAGKFGDLFGRKRVFQLGVFVFIVGSFFCGLANSMVLLITFPAVQGLGGGALTVTSTALIADVIPLRLRGQYQGALGAVFGVTTVIGPLLGGVFTDNLSWRWVFYVNVPIAVIVIALAARTIPADAARPSRPSTTWARVRGARRHRPDPGHILGRHAVRVGIWDDHRAVRGVGRGAGDLRVRGAARGRAHLAHAAVPQPGVHRVLGAS